MNLCAIGSMIILVEHDISLPENRQWSHDLVSFRISQNLSNAEDTLLSKLQHTNIHALPNSPCFRAVSLRDQRLQRCQVVLRGSISW